MVNVIYEHTSSFNSVLNRWFDHLTVSSVVDNALCYSLGYASLRWGVAGCALLRPFAGARLAAASSLDLSKNNLHQKIPLAVGSVF